jgi:feruloyl esterase
MELWLPASGWNGKFEANGNGGWTGSINPTALAAGLDRGYAAAMSDLGHEGGSANFTLGHPEKLIDFGYRAAHEMTLVSKAIVGRFYGTEPRLSYWVGCSAGGRSALMEAERYPADFDGIVAGSPGINWTGRATQAVWIAQAFHRDQASLIPANKIAIIHDAVLQRCDALDGVEDGVIDDPTRCNFDPRELECKDVDGPVCLTKAQVETARAICTAYPNQGNRHAIFPGFERGSELGWTTMAGPQAFRAGVELFQFVVFKDPVWDYKAFQFETDVARTEEAYGGILNALNPDLKKFAAHGGKLIQYHGWADPQIAPGSSVNYYKDVLKTIGASEKVQSFYRLFMVPGMAHCGGGDGTSTFDMLAALEGWVEKSQAPDRIPASRVMQGKVDRTRPLCPYPQVAQYKGNREYRGRRQLQV